MIIKIILIMVFILSSVEKYEGVDVVYINRKQLADSSINIVKCVFTFFTCVYISK